MRKVEFGKACTFLLGTVLAVALAAEGVEMAAQETLASSAEWEFVGGEWSLTDRRLTQQNASAIAYAFYRPCSLANPSVLVRFQVASEGSGVQAAGLVLCSSDSKSAYFIHYDTRNDQVIVFRGNLRDANSEIARVRNVEMSTGQWYTARAEAINGTLTAHLNERQILSVEDTTHPAGRVGVYTSQGRVEFERLVVKGDKGELAKPWEVTRFDANPPKEQPMATILDTRVLCKQPGRYIGWPSIAQAPNGDLLAVFSGDRTAHISPDGKVQMIRSSDGGETWSDPVTVYDSPIDDRDAGIIRTAKDTMLVSWFTNPGGGEWQGHWTIRSTDNGHTWDKPVRTEVTTPHGPTQLSDGRILYVGQRPHESHGPGYDVGIQESRDDGMTWQTIGTFPVPEGAKMLTYDECHVVECEGGRLLIAFRDCFKPHPMRLSESTDGGRTWAQPWETPVIGYPPHVIRLRNGWLLTVYGKRSGAKGEYACISKDEGKTWDVANEILLSHGPSGDLGYPASVELDDGTIWTVYYQEDQPGEKPCLMGTHWRPVE